MKMKERKMIFTCRTAARSTFDVGQKHNVSFLLSFLPLCLEYFQLVLLYGYLWTCLDPSNHIWDNLDPGAKFWVHGPFGPKFKNCNFLTKHYNMGVYGLAWTPATIFKVIWTLGPNFLGPLAPNSKIWNLLLVITVFRMLGKFSGFLPRTPLPLSRFVIRPLSS